MALLQKVDKFLKTSFTWRNPVPDRLVSIPADSTLESVYVKNFTALFTPIALAHVLNRDFKIQRRVEKWTATRT